MHGIRTDVVEALRAIRIPVLRWPGGCFADEYRWREGVGPRESRSGRETVLPCEIRGMKPARITGRILTADAINRCNTFDNSGAVKPAAFGGANLRKDSLQIILPPKSVVSLIVE